ncbi:lasso peptide biosynthesis B2 protein [Aurantiacibacter sediminis]|uniref:Lasso peptide biosynthesis B2 protein n=1 Tax=Aurantiacibacter sediminis TaxID=2793064 RepID=A0ABS0N5W1_9SPHN|nr:lasso peptide biosynthesis B2 protein [Aurantiacibacter sediminis]MBH5323157.1 lasso peptide biosynthesis B2 protein [Aurantiacibacter sediminis]
MTVVRSIKRRVVRMEIWLSLAWARFLIRYVPFRNWRHTLGPIDAEPDAGAWPVLSEQRLDQASNIGRLVNRVANRIRLFQVVCLPRAMAGRWVLARRGIPSRIIIGSKRGEEEGKSLLFHAWLMVGDRVLTGADERAEFLAFHNSRADLERG